MSLHDDVYREALHDWLDERPALLADARPDPAEYDDRYDADLDDARAAAQDFPTEIDE